MIYGSLETEPKEIFSAPNTVWNKLCFNTSLRYFRLVLKRLCIVQLNSYQIHFMAHKTPSCDTIMLSKVFDITVLDLMILMHDNPIRYSGHWKGWPWRGGPEGVALKGWALKISTFLGPNTNRNRIAHCNFRAHPFQWPSDNLSFFFSLDYNGG